MIVKTGNTWSLRIEDLAPVLPGSRYERLGRRVSLTAQFPLRYPSKLNYNSHNYKVRDREVEEYRAHGVLPTAEIEGIFLMGAEPNDMAYTDLFSGSALHLDKIAQGIWNAKYIMGESVREDECGGDTFMYHFTITHPWFEASIRMLGVSESEKIGHSDSEGYNLLNIRRKRTLQLYEHHVYQDNVYPEKEVSVPNEPGGDKPLKLISGNFFLYPEIVALMPFPTGWDGKSRRADMAYLPGLCRFWRRGGQWVEGHDPGFGYPFTDGLTKTIR